MTGVSEDNADHVQNRADDACRPFPVTGNKVDQGQDQQNPGEDQEGHGRPNCGNGHESRQECPDDTSHRIEGAQRSNCGSALFQTVHRVFDQGRCDRAHQKTRVNENDHASDKCSDDQ